MGKDDKYKGSNRENFNVQKSETYKQRVKKEELILEEVEKSNMEKLKSRMEA